MKHLGRTLGVVVVVLAVALTPAALAGSAKLPVPKHTACALVKKGQVSRIVGAAMRVATSWKFHQSVGPASHLLKESLCYWSAGSPATSDTARLTYYAAGSTSAAFEEYTALADGLASQWTAVTGIGKLAASSPSQGSNIGFAANAMAWYKNQFMSVSVGTPHQSADAEDQAVAVLKIAAHTAGWPVKH